MRIQEYSALYSYFQKATWKWNPTQTLLRPLTHEVGFMNSFNFPSFSVKVKNDGGVVITQDRTEKAVLVAEPPLFDKQDAIS